jgi:hypothetical protein
VLCYLEGATRDEAAWRLGCPLATLKSRLTRGRDRLHAALVRRGLGLGTLLLSALLVPRNSNAAATVTLVRRTAQVALAVAAGRSVKRLVSTQVNHLLEGGLGTMYGNSFKSVLALLLVGGLIASAGALAYSAADDKVTGAAPGEQTARPNPKGEPAPAKDSSESVTFGGRVLGHDGKPAVGATVFAMASYGVPIERGKTDADGRFDFRVRRGEVLGNDKRPSRNFQIVAAMEGCGPAWVDADDGTGAGDLTLRLVKDEVVEGRILTQEGKAVRGVTVRVLAITSHPYGEMVLGASPPLLGRSPLQPETATTDDEGRFRLPGAGRGRVLQIAIEGPGISNEFLQVATGGDEKEAKDRTNRMGNPGQHIYSAKFEHRAEPGRTITGVVREKGTGKPLAGIAVGGGGATTRTDEKGHYELRGWAKAKEYYVVVGVSDREHITMFTPVADTAGLGPLTAPDTELPRGIPFHAKVTDKATGKPVGGGEVWYLALWPNPEAIKISQSVRYGAFSRAMVDQDGNFTCPVLPGPGAVTVRGHGDDYSPSHVDPAAFFKDKLGDIARGAGGKDYLNVVGAADYTPAPQPQPQDQFQAITLIDPDADDREIKRDIVLQPARKLKVSVVGADGKPLGGFKVHGRRQVGESEDCAASDFTVIRPDPMQPRTLLVVHEASRQIGILALKGDETGPLDLRLQAWGTLTGRLVNADGEQCVGSLVNPTSADRSVAYPPSMQIKTDKDGKFRIEGLIPGRKYQLGYAHLPPSGRIEAKDVGMIANELILKDGESRDLGNVTARPLVGK